ncbi:MAG TPA: bifunctional DNA-formamidopyrimidine glycosylase/DNA-(apurinic or apyrimidinic site) lyase [Ktedonosporobacter sp.]|nr:bifunctional DNA-formamidopyrimidine glycosylase/DNA-(apurinic or apyrimidinic site) lyase [Ktedonosporobacter sp.]
MPELPEVEYTARQLRASVVGAEIDTAEIYWERIVGHPDPADFRAEIAAQRIEAVRRRGKYLLLDLSGNLLLSIHRRMTGNFLLLPPGWEIDTSLREQDPQSWSTRGPTFYQTHNTHSNQESSYSHEWRYCRACFNLGDGRRLLFTDPRKFGRIELWPREQEETALHGLGPEPLSESFTVESLARSLAQRKTTLKQALLDQNVIAGIGNIYADEALFAAALHPLRRTDSLTLAEIQKLHKGIVAVLTLAIEHGGTSFNDYRDLWGEAGDNYNHVRVYHQVGKPCVRCGTLIERMIVAQRSTHYCPGCQQLTGE